MRSLNLFLYSVAALLLIFTVFLAAVDHWANTAFSEPSHLEGTP